MPSARVFSNVGSLEDVPPRGINRYTLQALLSLISAALLFRIGGMINQVVISAHFGAGGAMDAYFVATAFPLLLVQLVSSALEAAIIPMYSRWRLHAQREAVSRLLSTLINCLALSAILLTLLLIWIRQPLVFLSAPGLDAARLQQAVVLAPWFYLVIPVSLVMSLLEALLNAEGQFGWPAYAGLLVPLTVTLLTIVGAKTWGILVLCIGGLSGTLLQFVIVGVRARQARLRYLLVIDLNSPELRLIFRAAWPVLLGALITQSGPLVDQIFASTLPTGSISALNYALKLVSIFISVVVVSLGRVALPHLSRQVARNDGDRQAFKGTLHVYLWSLGFCSLLLSISLLLVERPLVQLLFQRGAFSASDAYNTALILSGFLPGLTPMALTFLLTRAFNALGETRVPMYMALVSVGANAFCDALFARFWGGLGIALATSMVSLMVCLFLIVLLYRRIGPFPLWRVPAQLRALASCFISGRQTFSCAFNMKKRELNWYAYWRRACFYTGLTLSVLVIGIIATVRDAVTALRISVGSLILLNFLRYPFVLLLAWASLNVCIGSSLPGVNGNNLDMLLILPLLSLLVFFPWKKSFRRMPGLIWLALYLVWVLLGIGLSPLTVQTFLILWLTMLASIGAGALTLALISTRARLLWLIDGLLTTALLVALYGCYGFVTHQHGETDPATSLFRVTSLFTQATTCAFYLSSLLPLAFYRCIYTRGVLRLICLSVTSCLLAALGLTFTRSAYAGALGGAVIMILCLPDYRARFLIIGGLLCFSGILLYLAWSIHLPLLARFFAGDMATLNGRLYLWQALLNNFQVTRWLGSGLQSSDQLLLYLQVGTFGQGVIGTAPHSLFLGTLYDHGVIGLLLLCIAFFSVGRGLLRGIWRCRGERRMLYGAALACLFSVLLQSLGSRDLWIQAAGTPFWIIMALPLACYWTGKEKSISPSQGGGASYLAGSSPIPDFFPLCQLDECVEGEV